jgi:hypothetical protein
VPLQWNNTTGSSVLIKEPRLELTEQGGQSSAQPLRFFLIGKYSKFSDIANANSYSLDNTFILPSHSPSQELAVFRPTRSTLELEKKLNNRDEFQFLPNKRYKAEIVYEEIRSGIPYSEQTQRVSVGKELPMPPGELINGLYRYGTADEKATKDGKSAAEHGKHITEKGYVAYGWDFYSLACGGRLQPQNCEDNKFSSDKAATGPGRRALAVVGVIVLVCVTILVAVNRSKIRMGIYSILRRTTRRLHPPPPSRTSRKTPR